MKQYSDEILMVKTRENNLDYLAILFERYKVKLFNFFMRQIFNKQISEDLVQNVFERIIKYRGSYNESHKFKTWIYQIARNVLNDYFEKNKLELNDLENISSFADSMYDIDSNQDKNEKKKLLYKALEQLPVEQRQMIVLSKFQGLKYKEISHMYNTTEAAVKVKVHRAIHKLKEVFFSYDDNY